MKKRIYTLFSFLAVLVFMGSISTFAASVGNTFTDGKWLCTVTNKKNNTVSIAPKNKSKVKGDTKIPATVKHGLKPYKVTSIGDWAFDGCSKLTSVTIPDKVTSIGDGAFKGCSSLTSVTIPNSVTEIGGSAFNGCSKLTSVTIPDGVPSIGNRAFKGCSSLTSVTIPNSVTEIGGYTFSGCDGLKTVVIGNNVETIGDFAFSECSGLTSVTIPDNVTNIGGGAFANCEGLTSVTIPNSVTKIGEQAFNGCRKLTSVTIPDGVPSIGNWAFCSCSSLTSVTIPNSVTKIGEEAFSGCDGLKTVVIGQGVETIDTLAFKGCSKLTSVTIPNSVETIGQRAFEKCSSLTSVIIPDSVTKIGIWAFSGCSSLTEIIVGAANENYCAVEGVLFDKNKTTLIQYPISKTDTTYTIPNSVTSIGDSAFSGCSKLTSVTIGDKVETIEDSAFYGCSGLTSVEIGQGVKTIGKHAFYGCKGLTSVTIPNSVETIGKRAFDGCSGLQTVVIGNSVTRMEAFNFAGNSNLTSVTIGNKVENILGMLTFTGCSGLKTVFYKSGFDMRWADIPETATQIAYKVTNANTTPVEITPTKVRLGKGVTSITVCPNMVGPIYKLVAPTEPIQGLTIGHTWDSANGACKVCGVVKQNAPTVLNAEINNIFGQNLKLIVENPNGALPEGTQLVAEWIKPGTARHQELSEMRDPTHEAENIAFLEITLLDKDGNPLTMPLKDKVHVLLQAPNGFDKHEIQVALVKGDTDVEFSETIETRDGVDYISYWSDHFSPYAFIDTLSAAEKAVLNNSSSTSGTGSTLKTGDNYIEFYVALSSLLVAAVALMSLKRKKYYKK